MEIISNPMEIMLNHADTYKSQTRVTSQAASNYDIMFSAHGTNLRPLTLAGAATRRRSTATAPRRTQHAIGIFIILRIRIHPKVSEYIISPLKRRARPLAS